MKKVVPLIVIALLIGAVVFFVKTPKKSEVSEITTLPITSKIMKLTSSAFNNNEAIPEKFTCDGDNLNPPLAIADVPKDTKSLTLIIDDPDAPMGTWVHWTVWNMNPGIPEIAENSVPAGIEGYTSFGKPGYGGPCPPSGTHRYFFKLYALDTLLDLSPRTDAGQLEQAMQGHVLDSTELMGTYSRS